MGAKGRFAFIDGLTGLFSGPAPDNLQDGAKNKVAWQTVLRAEHLDAVHDEIIKSVEKLKDQRSGEGKVVVIIDGLDFLLASSPKNFTPLSLVDMLMDLREVSFYHTANIWDL